MRNMQPASRKTVYSCLSHKSLFALPEKIEEIEEKKIEKKQAQEKSETKWLQELI